MPDGFSARSTVARQRLAAALRLYSDARGRPAQRRVREQGENESPIEHENALFAAIVESSDDAITTVAPDLRVTYWNRSAERLLGYTAAETIGKPFMQHIAPENQGQAMAIIERLMAHPEDVVRFEGPIPRKDGTTVRVSTVCAAIRDREGKIVAIPQSNTDLTEHQRASVRLRCWPRSSTHRRTRS